MKSITNTINEGRRKLMISGQDTYYDWYQEMVDMNKGSYTKPATQEAVMDRLYDFITYLENEGYIDEHEFKKMLK